MEDAFRAELLVSRERRARVLAVAYWLEIAYSGAMYYNRHEQEGTKQGKQAQQETKEIEKDIDAESTANGVQNEYANIDDALCAAHLLA